MLDALVALGLVKIEEQRTAESLISDFSVIYNHQGDLCRFGEALLAS
jgi:hypothetical protein